MKIEHLALNVPAAEAMADWYVEHLGMRVVRRGATNQMCFLADDGGGTVLEFYTNAAAPIPDYTEMNPMVFHIAFLVDSVPQTIERLLAAGATTAVPAAVNADGDELAIVRDPWGVAVQLVMRAVPLPR